MRALASLYCDVFICLLEGSPQGGNDPRGLMLVQISQNLGRDCRLG